VSRYVGGDEVVPPSDVTLSFPPSTPEADAIFPSVDRVREAS